VLQLDIRDTEPARRESVMQAVRQECRALQQRRGVTITEEFVNADEPAACSAHTIALLEEICADAGIVYKKMVSRAYHDSLFMAQIAPISMIFIPCRGGVSHKPDEYASPADIARGTSVLAAVLAKLAEE